MNTLTPVAQPFGTGMQLPPARAIGEMSIALMLARLAEMLQSDGGKEEENDDTTLAPQSTPIAALAQVLSAIFGGATPIPGAPSHHPGGGIAAQVGHGWPAFKLPVIPSVDLAKMGGKFGNMLASLARSLARSAGVRRAQRTGWPLSKGGAGYARRRRSPYTEDAIGVPGAAGIRQIARVLPPLQGSGC